MPASRHGTPHTLLFSTCPLARPAPPLRRGLVHVVEVRLWRIAPRRGLSLSADKTTQHHSTRGASVAPSLCPKARARSATLQRIVVVGALEGAGRVFVGGQGDRRSMHQNQFHPDRFLHFLASTPPRKVGWLAPSHTLFTPARTCTMRHLAQQTGRDLWPPPPCHCSQSPSFFVPICGHRRSLFTPV